MKVKSYNVLSGDDEIQLYYAVEKYIQLGWEPLGGAFPVGVFFPRICQTMVYVEEHNKKPSKKTKTKKSKNKSKN